MLGIGNLNRVARFSRIGRLYKIAKMTKLVRLMKTTKIRDQFSRYFTDLLKIGVGVERMLLMAITFIVLIHIASCLWIFTARADDFGKSNWIYVKGYQDYETGDLYVTSMYFTVTTILTVGYGDISANNNGERVVCMLLMVIGTVSFSFGTGALSSIIQSYDSKEAALKEKISYLKELRLEYKIEDGLYNKIM